MTEPTIYKRPKRERWLELRKAVTTSTEMAPVAGIPKYGNTKFSIWHEKSGLHESTFDGNERTEIGQAIENAIAKLAGERIGARVIRLPDFYVDGTMGSSFDYEVDDESSEWHGWLVECKNVDGMIFRDQWEKVGQTYEPPEHITIQTQHQLEVSKRPGTIIAVLVGGSKLELIFLHRDEAFGQNLRVISDAFWDTVADGIRPDPIAEDADVIPDIYSRGGGDIYDATEDEAMSAEIEAYFVAKKTAKQYENRAKEIKANLLLSIGDASKVFAQGYTIDAGETKENPGKEITQEDVGTIVGKRAGFRRFTVKQRRTS